MRKIMTLSLLLTTILVAHHSYAGWDISRDLIEQQANNLLQKYTENKTHIKTNNMASTLSSDTLINGLRESLVLSSERAIKLISLDGGYFNDPTIRVPMPNGFKKLAGPLRKLGMGKQVDQFMQSINRAAEQAAPKATAILLNSIEAMSFEDVRSIYVGADDAATQYFRIQAGPKIADLFRPEVNTALNQVGATRYYNDLASQVAKLPLIGEQVKGDLTHHVTQAALNGLFLKLAQQEQLIRNNPGARTTDLLKQLWPN